MGDSFITVISIVIAGVLVFAIPLMIVAGNTDNVSQLAVQTETTEFGTLIANTEKMTMDDYQKYISTIVATGNSFEVEMTVYHLDENPSVKTTQAESVKIGENLYWVEYNSQVMSKLEKNGKIALKEGDMISIKVYNTNQTISQLLKNLIYKVSGNDLKAIEAQYSTLIY